MTKGIPRFGPRYATNLMLLPWKNTVQQQINKYAIERRNRLSELNEQIPLRNECDNMLRHALKYLTSWKSIPYPAG